MSNDPQAPIPGAQPPQESPDGAAQTPPAPQYSAPEYAAPEYSAPEYAVPEQAPGHEAPQYGAPAYAPPPAQPSGGYPPPPTGGYGTTSMPGGMVSQVGQPADLLTRFLARLIDYVILSVVLGIIGSVLVAAMFAAVVGGVYSGFGSKLVFGLLFSVVPLAYFAFMESSRGQTIGKMALKIRTEGPGGGNPSMEQALRRNAWTAISIIWIVPILGFFAGLLMLAAEIYIAVTINNNVATRQGWHDQFAGGTKVVKTS
ncbi:MAG TPA: RDD family protein [Actinomycetales bacterium]|nr:RDD family protein [Actinomycetales bacterium]